MDIKEKIKAFIRMRGPSLPVHIAKEIGKDTITASAFLSELVSSRELLMTNLKVGSSKLYYLPGQESKLQNFSSSLNEKDKRTYSLLKDKKIIRDRTQDPLIRVSLRQIKDFAVPLEVNLPSGRELFWKWYLTSNQEAEELIKSLVGINKTEKASEEPEDKHKTKKQADTVAHKEAVKEAIKDTSDTSDLQHQKAVPKIVPIKGIAKPETKTPEEPAVQKEPADTEGSKPEPKDHQDHKKRLSGSSGSASVREPAHKKEEKQSILTRIETKKYSDTVKKKEKKPEGEFADTIMSYLKRNEIEILDTKIIKKNSEFEFDVLIPSTVGSLRYYCRAKKKKKINDSDIAQAFIVAQSKKLPLLYLTNGELTKKADDMMGKEFKSVKVKQL